jgi:hypothetical protein
MAPKRRNAGLPNRPQHQGPLQTRPPAPLAPPLPVFILVLAALAGIAQPRAAADDSTDTDRLAREVIQNEIRAQAQDTNLLSYRELTRSKGKDLLYEYCQTKRGTIHRLLSVNGRPLSPSRRGAEDRRIGRLIASPAALEAAQKKERADAEEERKFLRLAGYGAEMKKLQDVLNRLAPK